MLYLWHGINESKKIFVIRETALVNSEEGFYSKDDFLKGDYPNLIAPIREVDSLKAGERICYLTFDDGPSNNTAKILDVLSTYNIKATFFVVGQSLDKMKQECITDKNITIDGEIEENAKLKEKMKITEIRKETIKENDIVERMKAEGHTVGLHANVHNYETLYTNLNSFLSDYDTLYQKLKEDYQIETALYRLPGGSACIRLNGKGKEYVQEMEKRGFSCFDWNVSGEDSVGVPTVDSIQRKVLTKGLECRRAYVLLHDSDVADQTPEALPKIIESFKKEGFVFKSLEHAESYVFPISR